MKLDKQLLDRLSKEASDNPRIRVSYYLRNSDNYPFIDINQQMKH